LIIKQSFEEQAKLKKQVFDNNAELSNLSSLLEEKELAVEKLMVRFHICYTLMLY
jgi:hypothetical protein